MPGDNASLELTPAAEATRLESKAELLCPRAACPPPDGRGRMSKGEGDDIAIL